MRIKLCCLLLLLVVPAGADAQGDSDANAVLLDRARSALNDLKYARADSLAREVLAGGPRLRRAPRIQALQIVAAANFPETPDDRREAAARSALTELIKLDLGATIPRDISWQGLDSLYTDVLRSTFATSVVARRDNPITGIDGFSLIRVRTNRPARVNLQARSRDGIEAIVLDSVDMSMDTTLKLRVARNGRPFLRGGEYDFLVTVSDPQTRETIVRRFEGIAIVPGIDYVPTPAAMDSSEYVPERATPQLTGGIVGGILLGVGAIALGTALRAPDPIKGSGEVDTRYRQVGIAIALGTSAAAWFDRGRMLDKNKAINRRREGQFAARLRQARAENEKRAADYRANIALDPEGR